MNTLKKIAVATLYRNSGEFYYQQIKDLFGDYVDVNRYCFEDRTIEEDIVADLLLVPSFDTYDAIKRYLKGNPEIVVAKRTISKKALQKIMSLPKGTKAILVNVSVEMAIDTIATIYQLGGKHIELTPFYPGTEKIPHIDIAITPGEAKYVPDKITTIIDIGDRVLDVSTIIDIGVKLKLEHILNNENTNKYFKEVISESTGLNRIIGKTNRLQSQFDILLKMLDEGIIAVDSDGIIHSCNESASKMFGVNKESIIGKRCEEIFSTIPFRDVLKTSNPIKERLIKIGDIDVVATVVPICDSNTLCNSNTLYGGIATIRKFSDLENKQYKLRAQLIGKGHKAKYTFEDILGDSVEINKTKDIAKRMAKSDSSILILGESGTGKELFAQAIHNASLRKDYQFVAINCAALPESLLESELFGYEEGAFTGARKGGKPGLFELAHMGTLFLDEIGEMPISLQGRLLRVLQEKEVMRIGGDSIINVDTRIITATNRDLDKLIEKGNFRQDLYYRLNVLTLRIPSLNQRKEDLDILINEFMTEFGSSFELSVPTNKLFFGHDWKGNVRELRNYIEYISNLGEKIIEPMHLPFNFFNTREELQKIPEEEIIIINRFINSMYRDVKIYRFILEKLEKSYISRENVGRRSLEAKATEVGLFLTEQEIRRILHTLNGYSMVEVIKGRGGTKITEFGRKTLKVLKQMG